MMKSCHHPAPSSWGHESSLCARFAGCTCYPLIALCDAAAAIRLTAVGSHGSFVLLFNNGAKCWHQDSEALPLSEKVTVFYLKGKGKKSHAVVARS